MRTYSDPEINYWADVFMACHLAREGLRFEDFLADPQGQLNRYGMDDAPQIIAEGYLPLLPNQARLRRQLLLTAAEPTPPSAQPAFLTPRLAA
ncbi:MAG: hypothetical protein AB1766_11465 [Pseudomonadota bacterium]